MTRAALVSPFGSVHRVTVDSNANPATACGLTNTQSPVTPAQARVFSLGPCPLCWPDGRWAKFLEGASR